jgi:putative membrane protein
MHSSTDEAAILALERPHATLWTYYLLRCLVIPPLLPFTILPSWFRYQTLRYRFSDEGISMSWGVLFRRQVIIHYARIQDIHLRSNVVERWLGLARVQIQTASGQAGAEMTLEGFREFEAIRDFLYSRMRGVRSGGPASSGVGTGAGPAPDAELVDTLRAVATELRELRLALARLPTPVPPPPAHRHERAHP